MTELSIINIFITILYLNNSIIVKSLFTQVRFSIKELAIINLILENLLKYVKI